MNKLAVLFSTIAFVVLISEISSQKCSHNSDCYTYCNNDNHAVCDPSGICHCHAHGEISCNNNAICIEKCQNPSACCNNDHHCHCDEPCSSG